MAKVRRSHGRVDPAIQPGRTKPNDRRREVAMKYVEFYDTRHGRKKRLGEVRLERGRLVMSKGLPAFWQRSWAYRLLGRGGYNAMYEPESILAALPLEFTDPEFQASEVKTR